MRTYLSTWRTSPQTNDMVPNYLNKRYLINKRIGKGIQGVVLSAFDTKSNMKKVAIKLFDVNASEKSIQKREIDVLTNLKELGNIEGFPRLSDH